MIARKEKVGMVRTSVDHIEGHWLSAGNSVDCDDSQQLRYGERTARGRVPGVNAADDRDHQREEE